MHKLPKALTFMGAILALAFALASCKANVDDDPTMYTVTFDSKGGTSVAQQTVESGKTATKPAVPSKNGFVFIGWYSDTGLESAFNFDTAITGDITLYAKWTHSGIYTESSAYYINVDSQSAPSDGNSAW